MTSSSLATNGQPWHQQRITMQSWQILPQVIPKRSPTFPMWIIPVDYLWNSVPHVSIRSFLSPQKCRDLRHACRLVLCMGSLLLSIVELAETVEMLRSHPYTYEILFVSYSRPLFIAKAITFICRFIFHSVQFLFLFRYGNVSPVRQREKKLAKESPRFLLL